MSPQQQQVIKPTMSIKPKISWGDWLKEYGGKLLLFARQQTRSHADAEDVLQEALIRLARKVHEGSFDGGQEAWLPYVYTSIRRVAIDLGRKNDRRTLREEKVETDRQAEAQQKIDPWFDSLAANEETRQQLETSLKQLPEKFAEVIILKMWGEQTFAEIAETLEISPHTAASRYRYGLEALKRLLSQAKNQGDL